MCDNRDYFCEGCGKGYTTRDILTYKIQYSDKDQADVGALYEKVISTRDYTNENHVKVREMVLAQSGIVNVFWIGNVVSAFM